MRFGIHTGQQYTDYPGYVALWRKAEELGLDWASVFDHFIPIQVDPEGPCFDGLTALAGLAGATTRLRCGVIVTGVTYRNPALLAKIATTIDHISGGRMELGMGAAWFELEHEQYGFAFPPVGQRMDMLEESVTIVKSLLTQERTTFEGRHFKVKDAMFLPKPLQKPSIPIWIGGGGEQRTLRIVAKHADGWNYFLGPEDAYRHKLDVLAGHCQKVERDPTTIRKSLIFQAVLDSTREAAAERAAKLAAEGGKTRAPLGEAAIVGTADDLIAALYPFIALGVSDFLLGSRPPGDSRTLELFAEKVASALRK